MNHLDDGPDAYKVLANTLRGAYDQASKGKGKERHADSEPFESQKICVINRWLADSPVAGPLFQVVKKTVESSRLPHDRAIHELQGAINYLAAAIILLEEQMDAPNVKEKPLDDHCPMEIEIERQIEISEVEAYQDHAGPKYCIECNDAHTKIQDMPCKKCFYVPFKPHFRKKA